VVFRDVLFHMVWLVNWFLEVHLGVEHLLRVFEAIQVVLSFLLRHGVVIRLVVKRAIGLRSRRPRHFNLLGLKGALQSHKLFLLLSDPIVGLG
jgi:hypothetical protein